MLAVSTPPSSRAVQPPVRRGQGRWPLRVALSQLPTALVSFVLIWTWSRPTSDGRLFTLFDDAMISMSYGRTLSDTGAFVWYMDAPRAQGFSNPLWSLLMAAIHSMGFTGSSAALAVALIGMVILLLAGSLVAQLVRMATHSFASSDTFALTAGAVSSLTYPMLFWTLRGMEVGLLAFLVTLMLLAIWKAVGHSDERPDSHRTMWLIVAAVSGVTGILVRVDFIVVVIAASAVLLVHSRRSRWLLTPALTIGGVAVATVVLVLVWQDLYFGDLLPITYHLKMDGVSAADRVIRGLVSTSKLLPIIVAVVAAYMYARRDDRVRGTTRILIDVVTASVLVAFAYQTWVGGDAWEWSMIANRFVAPVIPLVVIIVFIAMALRSAQASVPLIPIHLMLLLVVTALGGGLQANPFRYDWMRAGALVVVVLSACLLVVVAPTIQRLTHLTRDRIDAAVTGWSVWSALSILPLVYSIVIFGSVAPLVDFDADTVIRAKALRSALDATERVATVRAGADSYYTEQKMVDLLGKNDLQIALSPPHREASAGEYSTFYPGHDKWDYMWSISQLQPGIIMDMWVADESTFAWLKSLGYVQVCLSDGSQVWASEGALDRNPRLQRC